MGLLVGTLWLTVAELGLLVPWATALLLGSLCLASSWMQWHLHLAQLSILIAFFMTLTWIWLRRGRDGWAGVALGCALTLKLFPAMLLVPLFLGRRWRTAGWALFVYLVVALVMTSRVGLAAWADFWAAEPGIVNFWIGRAHNGSLPGVFHRLYRAQCLGISPYNPRAMHLSSLTSALLALLLWWPSRRAWASPTHRIDLPLAAVCCLAVLANPFMFEHSYALFVVPTIVGSYYLVVARHEGLGWIALVPLLLLQLLVVASHVVSIHDKQPAVPWRFVTPTQHQIHHILEYAGSLPALGPMLTCALLAAWLERRRPRSAMPER